MKLNSLKYFGVVSLLFVISFGYAQRPVLFNKDLIENPQIRFSRLTTDNGLSHNRITDICQDTHGFIWIATTDGLNRYDGTSFEIFTHNEDNHTSITSSFIHCLEENQRGDLYIGTKRGLNKYDRIKNRFQSVPLDHMNKYPVIRQIMFDNDSVLWIETEEGYLLKFDVDLRKILAAYKHQAVYQTYYLYHDIYRDAEGILWIGMRNRDPMYLDEVNDTLISIPADENDITSKRAVDMACFYEDSYSNFWFTALDGIYKFNRTNQTFQKFIGTTTYDIHEDKEGNIWFGTGSGIMKYTPENEEIILMNNEKDNPNSISNNNVYNIMEDRMGNLWLGTAKGVNIYSPPSYPFHHYTHIPGISNSPEGYEVSAVSEDDKNNLWIGYEKDGLDYFNRSLNTFTHFLPNNGNSIATNKVSALYYDGSSLWIGLWRGIGFNKYDIDKNKFTLYTYWSASLEKDWYSSFAEDRNGNFYIGFWGADGLTKFDRRNGKFLQSLKRRFDRVNCSRLITDIVSDKEGSLWFGTTDCGLHRYIPDTDSGVSYFSDGETENGLFSNEIADVAVDQKNNIWLINSCLQTFMPEKDTFIAYGVDELKLSELTSLVSDKRGNLWIGTNSDGLFKFNTENNVFSQYLKDDGLYTNSFTDAAIRLSSGELFFGSNNGFVIFNPDEIVEQVNIPDPYFGRLYVYDHILSHDLNNLEEVILEPEQNIFTVELLSSDIVNPGRYNYQCWLEGYDNDWVDINGFERKVRYAAVPAGRYTLKYRIGNRDGYWSETIATVKFKVLVPFYTSWWFIAIVLLLILIIIVAIVKQREFDLTQKQRNAELQQRLFRLQMNPHFMYNSLLAIQSFIFSNDPKDAGNYLSDFARLFRLILNNSKSEFITLSKEIETLNLYLKLQSLRYPDRFEYEIFVDDEVDYDLTMIPPMLAQPMIENALEHGIFYKEGKGRIDIRFKRNGDQLLFEVEDNGIGLTKAKEKKKEGHTSSAIDITRERIKILGKRHRYYAIFEIKELQDENSILGTIVRFNIPTKLSLFENDN